MPTQKTTSLLRTFVRNQPRRTHTLLPTTSTIEGFASVFNDIRISQMSVVQGFESDGSGQGTSVVSDTDDADLNVGTSYLHVEVEHRGSEPTSNYELVC